MESGGTRVITTVLGILLVIGCGIGGYYLGYYLDLQEAKKNANPVDKRLPEADSPNPKTFKSEALGIEFTYPGNWTKRELDLKDGNAKEVSIVSPDGSYFYFMKSEKEGTTVHCDAEDSLGTKSPNKACEFFLENHIKFAKYRDPALTNNEEGEYWVVAEQIGVNTPNKYIYNSSNGFYYQSKTANDLVELDNIMKSVVRK